MSNDNRWTIDRIHDIYAVLESGERETLALPREQLPKDAREGDTLIFDGESYHIDKDSTAERKERITNLFEKLKERRD